MVIQRPNIMLDIAITDKNSVTSIIVNKNAIMNFFICKESNPKSVAVISVMAYIMAQ